jgi:hypothetical protein
MMHDHNEKKKPMFCTLMGEICVEGWTSKMGENPETHERPRCNKWVGVFVNNKVKKQVEEVFDCNEQWATDMIQQVAEEVYQNAVATEQARNLIADQTTGLKQVTQVFSGILEQVKRRQNQIEGKQT